MKAVISLRDLAVACREVSRALEAGDLREARRLVGYHLVSRPTSSLDASQVASAAIESAGENLTAMLRDHRRTASPNAGWTMPAVAGALGVVLEKPGAYRLGGLGGGRRPGPGDVGRSIRLLLAAAAGATAMAGGWLLLRSHSG